MNSSYASLSQLRADIKALSTQDDVLVLQLARQLSRRADLWAQAHFAPQWGTRRYAPLGTHIDDLEWSLYLPQSWPLSDPLLELGTVKLLDLYMNPSQTLVEGRDFERYPYGSEPVFKLRRFNTSWSYYTPFSWQSNIEISGFWGYREAYSTDGWSLTGTSLQGVFDIGDTTLQVSDIDAIDPLLQLPLFELGRLYRLDNELMEITGRSSGTGRVTFSRGSNGTLEAPHQIGAVLRVWNPQPQVVRAVSRWAGFVQSRLGSFENFQLSGVGATVWPSDIPDEVASILSEIVSGRSYGV